MVKGWSVCRAPLRKRGFEPEDPNTLRRCLNRLDTTALGLGSTLSIGVYVLIGLVAMRMAGPSIILSFLLAAVMTMLAGLCYAEFGARVPLAGASYTYAYVALGELTGFLVGWNNILQFVFGSATIAKGLSSYINHLSNNNISDWFIETMPLTVFSLYFDLLSFLLVLLFGVLLAIGVRESSMVNNVFCLVNVIIIIFVVFAGAFKADSGNWSIPGDEVPSGFGAGGFFPYGVWGTLKGAVVCFYGFGNLDVLNSAAEEMKDPRRTIPMTILTMFLCALVLCLAVSTVVTMMVPYYEITVIASIHAAFSYVGWNWAWWIVVIGSLSGICSSLFGTLFALSRLLYSMAYDGLLFHLFTKVSAKRKTPIIAIVIFTIIVALFSAIFEFEQLVLTVCVGTLCSYTIVAIGTVLLRHDVTYISVVKTSFFKQIIGRGDTIPTERSKLVIHLAMALYISLCFLIAMVIHHTGLHIVAVIALHILAIATIIIMVLQPANKDDVYFQTPLVPLLPCLSIYTNIHLMVIINWQTWVRVLLWLVIGLPIYVVCVFCYKQNAGEKTDEDDKIKSKENINGKPAVQIVVESPTPPSTVARGNSYRDENDNNEIIRTAEIVPVHTNKTEDMIMEQILVENNEEKEAKIIELLDQVLQAEEDSYEKTIILKENKDEAVLSAHGDDVRGDIPHRKSLSELSDAGSDASVGNQVLSKYDVIAQVHREDLPKVNEEEERNNSEDINNEYDEDITAFNESDTNSRTDESGYSDTIDRQASSDSLQYTNVSNIPVPPTFQEKYFNGVSSISPNYSNNIDKPIFTKSSKEPNTSNIPVPPPLDESYFNRMTPITPSGISERVVKPKLNRSLEEINVSKIPVPPPFDEKYFSKSTPFAPIKLNNKKFNTISSRHSRTDSEADDDGSSESRVSLQSNNSQGDGYMRFGSSRQVKLMSKLNYIFQKRLDTEEEEPKKERSQSTGNVIQAPELAVADRERPQIFLDLKKELLSRDSLPTLRPVKTEEIERPIEIEPEELELRDENTSLSRQDLKSKLEGIFAVGGPQLLAKPRLMKSNTPTLDDSYQTDIISTESLPKLPKENNDTLKRQKEKFGHVLNSIRLSYKDDGF